MPNSLQLADLIRYLRSHNCTDWRNDKGKLFITREELNKLIVAYVGDLEPDNEVTATRAASICGQLNVTPAGIEMWLLDNPVDPENTFKSTEKMTQREEDD